MRRFLTLKSSSKGCKILFFFEQIARAKTKKTATAGINFRSLGPTPPYGATGVPRKSRLPSYSNYSRDRCGRRAKGHDRVRRRWWRRVHLDRRGTLALGRPSDPAGRVAAAEGRQPLDSPVHTARAGSRGRAETRDDRTAPRRRRRGGREEFACQINIPRFKRLSHPTPRYFTQAGGGIE